MTIMQLSRNAPILSPLEPVFAPHVDKIPFAFQEQFLYSPNSSYRMTLDGTIHHVWHKPLLHPLFWLLGKAGVLVPKVGSNIQTVLEVVAGHYTNGEPYHEWNRTLYFQPPIHFNTVIVYDTQRQLVGDLVGPHNSIYLLWHAQFHPPATFTLDTASCAFQVGKKRLWMSRWVWSFLLGVVRFVQRIDESQPDTVHIDLLITHPIFGKIFGYNGTFRVKRK
jgi:hypothetical protein